MKFYKSLLMVVLVVLFTACSQKEDGQSKGKIDEPKPFKQTVSIQTILTSTQQKQDSHPGYLFDDKAETSWIIQNSEDVIGEYFELRFNKEIFFNSIVTQQIKNIKLSSKNRIKKLMFHCVSNQGVEKLTVYLSDKDNPQKISLAKIIRAKKISIYVQELFSRKKAQETGLSEIAFYHDEDKVIFDNILDIVKNLKNKREVGEDQNHLDKSLEALRIIKVLSSSTKRQTKKTVYKAYNLIDNNPKTAWVEGQTGEGIKEFIQFDFKDKKAEIKGIRIVNGYAHKKEFKRYNRVKDLSVELSLDTNEGSVPLYETKLTLKDSIKPQFFPLDMKMLKSGKGVKGVFITITINSVYYGKKPKETALSEITFYKAKKKARS